MSKKRIHELAKEYGLSGKDLAAKLRSLGYSNAKSHMTALDEFELLQAQALLEAHGIIQETGGESVEDLGGGLILRKKKKKKVETPEDEPEVSAEDDAPEPDDDSEPESHAHEEAAPEPVAAEVVEAPPAPEPAAPEAPAPVKPEPAPVQEPEPADEPQTVEPAGQRVEPDPVQEPAPEPAATPEPRRDSAVASETKPEQPAVAASAEAPTAPEPKVPAPAQPKAAATTGSESAPAAPAAAVPSGKPPVTKAPVKPKRQGKVVGFIDLSKVSSGEPKKSQSRRLRSRDDVVPDVQPTMRHDPRKAMMRGDRGARDVLSASQLREREAGRFLRRGRTQQTGSGRGRTGGRGRHRDMSSPGSPYAGTEVKIEEPVTVKKLAETLSVKGNEMLKTAWGMLGFGKVNINSLLDEDTATLLANEFEVELSIIKIVEAEEALIEDLKATRSAIEEQHLELRSPTVAFLGHVDHGKTTLIDKIRASAVADGEDGGITQHIGAYRVTTEKGHDLTIVDTPGHAAFTNMRARGAKAVDVVVLVVAADAGVQPQTEEALNHARAAKSPIVVALTKIDRAEANPQKAQEQLAGLSLIPEDWGGETAMIPVSGITGQGIQDLLERVFLESEILELNCHADGPASGVVLEAEVEQGKGIVAHVLVQDGTLKRGDVILAGEGYGKVRSLTNDRGKVIEFAGPSVPVEVSGLSALPGIGEAFHVVKNLASAKEVAEERSRKTRAQMLAESSQQKGATFLETVTGPKVEEVNVIIRTDVQGSAEVLKQSVVDLAHTEVRPKVIQSGVGAVTENDVLLASTSDALIVAFRVGVNAKARQAAEREGVEIRSYNVLYSVLDDLRDVMEGRLAPEIREEVAGHAEVKRVFKSSKFGAIAGCAVLDGTVARDHRVRLLRDDTVVWTGGLASIRREKDEAKEVREGFECGILLKGYNDVREGDIIESFKVTEIKRTLEDAS